MRTDTFVGLNKRGAHIVAKATVKETTSLEGAFGNRGSLHTWLLPDGTVLRETIQVAPWSSGPNYFYALKDIENTWVEDSLWTKAEIDSCL